MSRIKRSFEALPQLLECGLVLQNPMLELKDSPEFHFRVVAPQPRWVIGHRTSLY